MWLWDQNLTWWLLFVLKEILDVKTYIHYSNVTLVPWYLKSVANNEENNKVPFHWAFVGGSIIDQWIPLTKTNNVESVSMSWHNHVICLLVPQATWFTGGADVRLRFWHDSQRVSIIFCHYGIRVTPGTHFWNNLCHHWIKEWFGAKHVSSLFLNQWSGRSPLNLSCPCETCCPEPHSLTQISYIII